LTALVSAAVLVFASSCGFGNEIDVAPSSFTTSGPPSEQRLAAYAVFPPDDATDVSYWSNEGWHGGTLWLKFKTSRDGLESFLLGAGLDQNSFSPGYNPINSSDAKDVGWIDEIEALSEFSGYRTARPTPSPEHEPSYQILIDESRDDSFVVYVVALIV
jgi:hypothetical protein